MYVCMYVCIRYVYKKIILSFITLQVTSSSMNNSRVESQLDDLKFFINLYTHKQFEIYVIYKDFNFIKLQLNKLTSK